MSAAAITAPLARPEQSIWRRPFGGTGADAMLRATGLAGVMLVAVLLLIPGSAVFLPLILSVLLFRGPVSGLVPIGVEPVLMLYGQLYSPWVVAGVAALASAYAEVVSQHLVRGVLDLRALGHARNRLSSSRMMRLFDRRPAVAIAITALSPIPDTLTRVLAAAARYPVGRYVLADTVGRFPKLLIPALLGTTLHLSPTLLLMVIGGSSAIAGILATARWGWGKHLRRSSQSGV